MPVKDPEQTPHLEGVWFQDLEDRLICTINPPRKIAAQEQYWQDAANKISYLSKNQDIEFRVNSYHKGMLEQATERLEETAQNHTKIRQDQKYKLTKEGLFSAIVGVSALYLTGPEWTDSLASFIQETPNNYITAGLGLVGSYLLGNWFYTKKETPLAGKQEQYGHLGYSLKKSSAQGPLEHTSPPK